MSLDQEINHKVNQLFDFYAILPVGEFDPKLISSWREWLTGGRHASMSYMERERDDLRRVMPTVRSVVVVGLAQPQGEDPQVARCFSGSEDYHDRVKGLLWEVMAHIKQIDPRVKARGVVDSAPIFEKALAVMGGLGWIGRNSLLVTPRGSFFNLGVLLLNVDLAPRYGDLRGVDRCGSCRLCIDSCPLGAIGEDRMIDARRCVSYLNMEAQRLAGLTIGGEVISGWRIGCDSCQLCCPWNLR